MQLIKKGDGKDGKQKSPGFGTWILVVTQALISFCGNLQIGLFKDRNHSFSLDRDLESDC